mgnify:CR=1 FL=1
MGMPETLPRHKMTEHTRKGRRTQTRMHVRLYEEERCMGTPEMLPHHKTTEHTRKGTRTQTQMPIRLYEKRCMSAPETLRCHKTAERITRRGREHKHKCPYAFMRRRGEWMHPKRSLVTRRPKAQQEKDVNTQGKRHHNIHLKIFLRSMYRESQRHQHLEPHCREDSGP